MAFKKTPKIFASDLSNYSEIRRGLSPAVRNLTPTKKQLQSVDVDVRESFIKSLNEWRRTPQSVKARAGQNQTVFANVFTDASSDDYYSAKERVQLSTAGLKMRSMSPERAQWEIRESFNATGRLRTQAFYKAQYYLEKGTWDPELAAFDMLDAIVNDRALADYGQDTVDATVAEYLSRIHSAQLDQLQDQEAKDRYLQELIDTEGGEIRAAVYQNLLDVARVING